MARLEAVQKIPFNETWGLQLRAFTGIVSEDAASEYQFARSSLPAQNWMQSGLTRAKGTIPQNWMESGHFQVAGGANLRGYIHQDVESYC